MEFKSFNEEVNIMLYLEDLIESNIINTVDDFKILINNHDYLLSYILKELCETAKSINSLDVDELLNIDNFYFLTKKINYLLKKTIDLDEVMFDKILIDSKFTKEDIESYKEQINYLDKKLTDVNLILLSSESKNINIFQNSDIEKVFKNKSVKNTLYKNFINFISKKLNNSILTEYISKVAVFQEARLKDLIKEDNILSELFIKYNNSENLSSIDINYISNKFKKEIEDLHLRVPRHYETENFSHFKIDYQHRNDVIKTESKSTPDAYLFYKNKYYLSTSTSLSSFKNQNSQNFKYARAMYNTIQNNELINKYIDIKDFEILSVCQPIVNKNQNIFKVIQSKIIENELNIDYFSKFKRIAIDSDIIKNISVLGDKEYNQFREKINYFIMGENIRVKLKDSKEQFKESFENLLYVSNNLEDIFKKTYNNQEKIKEIIEIYYHSIINMKKNPLFYDLENNSIKKLLNNFEKLSSFVNEADFINIDFNIDINFSKSNINNIKDYFEKKNIKNEEKNKVKDEYCLNFIKKDLEDKFIDTKKCVKRPFNDYHKYKYEAYFSKQSDGNFFDINKKDYTKILISKINKLDNLTKNKKFRKNTLDSIKYFAQKLNKYIENNNLNIDTDFIYIILVKKGLSHKNFSFINMDWEGNISFINKLKKFEELYEPNKNSIIYKTKIKHKL